MSVCKKNERVSARIPSHVYDTLTQAAKLLGTTLNQFLVQSALEKAQVVIEKERIINLTLKSAEMFFNSVENPPPPSKKLKAAMKAYKNSFSNVEN